MRGLRFAALTFGSCGIALGASAGDTVPDSLAVYQGFVQAQSYGELLECTGPVLRTRLTYLAMPGVCDDLGPSPCAGRLVAEVERCVPDSAALAAGELSGGYSRSAVRFCFDPVPQEPGVSVECGDHNWVGLGSWTGAGRAAGGDAVLAATAVLSLRRVRPFVVDGRSRRLPRTPQVQHFSQQRSVPGPGGCAAAPQGGCGVIGVGVP